jgi:acetylglutamate kinase
VTDVVVVKLGGHVLDGPDAMAQTLDVLAADIKEQARAGTAVVVVHGAGPQITDLIERFGRESRFVDGLRVTDDVSMDLVAMALALVNVQIVTGLCARGVLARGQSGPDGGLLTATPAGEPWGRVGSNVVVRAEALTRNGHTLVINPIATDATGGLLNCNGDEVAGAIAAAVGARALILLCDVAQVREAPENPASAVASLTVTQVEAMVTRGQIRDGMIPKVRAACAGVRAGAARVVITDGGRAGALAAAMAGKGVFTEVVQ